jgi:hypothetical protein
MKDLWKFVCVAGLCVIVVFGLLGVRGERLKRARTVALLDRAVGLFLGLPVGGVVVSASIGVKAATDIATAIGTVVAAGAAVATAAIALIAASDWLKGLENQRIDEAISAVRELQSAIDAVIWCVQNHSTPDEMWSAHRDAYRISWRRFNQAYGVATRYHPSLPSGAESDFVRELERLPELYRNPNAVALDQLKVRVHALARKVEDALRTAAPLVA